MDQLNVGDKVLTGTGEYETVYAIDHRHPTKATRFLQIFHSSSPNSNMLHQEKMESEDEHKNEPLEVSSRHMVFLENRGSVVGGDGKSLWHPVPAYTVKIGDRIRTMEGPREVKRISNVTRRGLINVLTPSGTIVVGFSGIVASTYAVPIFFSSSSAEVKEEEWSVAIFRNYPPRQLYLRMPHPQVFYATALWPYRYVRTKIASLFLTEKHDTAKKYS